MPADCVRPNILQLDAAAGPEFLLAYSLVGKLLLIAVLAWLASFPLSRYVRITPRGETLQGPEK